MEPNTLPHQRVFDAEATNIRRIIRVLAKTPEKLKASQSSFCSDRLTGNHIVYFRVRLARYHRGFCQRQQVILGIFIQVALHKSTVLVDVKHQSID